MKGINSGLTIIALAIASLFSTAPSWAIPSCVASPTCTLDGQTFTLTGGSSGSGLTFIADLTTPARIGATADRMVEKIGPRGSALRRLHRWRSRHHGGGEPRRLGSEGRQCRAHDLDTG